MSGPEFWTTDRRKARRNLQRRVRELEGLLRQARSPQSLDPNRFTFDLELKGTPELDFADRKQLTLQYFATLAELLENPDMSTILAEALDNEIRRLSDPGQIIRPPERSQHTTQLGKVGAYHRRQERRAEIEAELQASSVPTFNFGYSILNEPALPMPWVHYPGRYGLFCAFSKHATSEATFCACQERAVMSFLQLETKDLQKHFPRSFHGVLTAGEGDPNRVQFHDRICHRCSGYWPNLRFSFEEDLTSFHQACIPYILQEWLRCGIYVPSYPWRDAAGSVPCPEEEEIQRMHLEADELYKKLYPTPPRDLAVAELDPEFVENKVRYNALRRVVGNIIEDRVRADFGYPLIGSRLQSETVLFDLVSQILPQETIYRHVRSIPALKGLEIDIWIPRLQLGIEYQGKQHYEPVAHWGGAEGLRLVQERDRLKKQRCSEIGIQLVEIKYTESLTLDHVRRRLYTFV